MKLKFALLAPFLMSGGTAKAMGTSVINCVQINGMDRIQVQVTAEADSRYQMTVTRGETISTGFQTLASDEAFASPTGYGFRSSRGTESLFITTNSQGQLVGTLHVLRDGPGSLKIQNMICNQQVDPELFR